MAEWSQAEIEKRKAEKIESALAERSEIFKQFRDGGWEINVIDPLLDREIKILPDTYPKIDPHYRVKMPNAWAVRIKTVGQLLRMAKGIA